MSGVQALQSFVNKVLSSWTALNLARDNAAGGDETDAKIKYLTENLLEYVKNAKDQSDVEDILEDYLDAELNTICEDGSVSVISKQIYAALQSLKRNDVASIWQQLENVPKPCQTEQCPHHVQEEEVSGSDDDECSSSDNEMS